MWCKNTIWAVTLGLLMPSVAAAWGRVPSHYLDPIANPPPDCPADTHIVGQGISNESEADARQKARSSVARQIESTIETEAKRTNKVLLKDGLTSSSTDLYQKTTESSNFGYGEKIHDLGKVYKKRKKYYALSCLDRQETIDHIWEQSREAANRFEAAYAQASTAAAQNNRSRFSRESRIALKEMDDLLPALVEINSLQKTPSRKYSEYLNQHLYLLMEAQRFRSEVNFAITVKSDVALTYETQQSLKAKLRASLQAIDLGSDHPVPECRPNGASHIASIQPQTDCQTVMSNHFCKVSVQIQIEDCNSAEIFSIILEEPTLSGRDRWKQENAIQKAIQSLTEETLTPLVKKSLIQRIPLPK